jgi:hypothetical protein
VADDATVLAADRYDVGDEMNGDLSQKGTESPNPFPSVTAPERDSGRNFSRGKL